MNDANGMQEEWRVEILEDRDELLQPERRLRDRRRGNRHRHVIAQSFFAIFFREKLKGEKSISYTFHAMISPTYERPNAMISPRGM